MRIISIIFFFFNVQLIGQVIDISGEWEYRVGNSGSWNTCKLPNTISNILKTEAPEDYVRFRKVVNIPIEILDKRSVRISLENVDTYCTILVNDDKVGQLKNFFIPADIEIRNNLLPGENEIVLEFMPTKWVYEKEWKKQGVKFEGPRQKLEIEMHERKPRYMSEKSGNTDFGVYGEMKINVYNYIEIREMNFKLLSESEGRAKVLIKLHADVMETGVFKFESKYFTQEEKILTGSDRDVIWTFFIDDFKFWFPKGLGDQDVIKDELTVSYRRLNQKEYREDVKVKYRVGFHQFELIQNPKVEDDFSFEMEGMEMELNTTVFNYQYYTDPKKQLDYCNQFIQKALNADVQLINVHGNGGYPPNAFYAACDSLGILVWQDFAFSGMGYPSDSLLYKNARNEVNHHLRRISQYTSLLLFSGSADIEKNYLNESLMQKYGLDKKDLKVLKKGQEDLFGRIIPIALNKFNSRFYYKKHSPDFSSGKREFSFGSFIPLD